MPTLSFTNFDGINTGVNPLALPDGNITQSLNIVSDPFGAKSKRGGYVAHPAGNLSSQINQLWSWYRQDGSTFNLYAQSGSTVYYSTSGTGTWTAMGNGTFSSNNPIGHTVLNDVMIAGDGVGSTRHSTDGVSWTNTTLAPTGQFFDQFHDRVYIGGTGNVLFYSCTDDATNWNTSGTSDSSSIIIPGEGKIGAIFKNSDKVIITKTAFQQMHSWDGFNLVDLSTNLGPTSPYSIVKTDNYSLFLNRLGVFSYAGGVAPQLLTNPIQKMIYNKAGSAIAGSVFSTAPAGLYIYDYLCAIGTTTDDFTQVTIPNAILKYDIRLNESIIWQFDDFPNAFASYRDTSGNLQLMFGNTSGGIFQYSGTATTDNGAPITSVVEMIVTGKTLANKNFQQIRGMFNPGCEAQVEVSVQDTLSYRSKKYVSLGHVTDGVFESRIPSEVSQGRLMYVKISDSSTTNPFQMYTIEVDLEEIERR